MAGVCYDKKMNEISPNVLQQGIHKLKRTKVILYETIDQEEDFAMDFLFKNKSLGRIEFTVRFAPIIDSLPIIYYLYRQDYIKILVVPETNIMVRNLLKSLTPDEATKDLIADIILAELSGENELSKLVDIKAIEIRNFEYPAIIKSGNYN